MLLVRYETPRVSSKDSDATLLGAVNYCPGCNLALERPHASENIGYPLNPAGWVYFIECSAGGPLKVGWAKQPTERLRLLQCGCPYPLRIVGAMPGDTELERIMHRLAVNEQIVDGGTEWFRRDGRLGEWVDAQAARHPWIDPPALAVDELHQSGIEDNIWWENMEPEERHLSEFNPRYERRRPRSAVYA